jgi:hypothetical protein
MQRQGDFALLHESAKSGKMANICEKSGNCGVFCETGQGMQAHA